MKILVCSVALAIAACMVPLATVSAQPLQGSAESTSNPANYPANYAELTSLFDDWRKFVVPVTVDFKPDYSIAAIAAKKAGFPKYQGGRRVP